ncbi:MAG: hypothetical protein EBQ96_06960 [Proteobacteria bacterium]|nr:hypothetical protein [Pseudomonadota bacterium]
MKTLFSTLLVLLALAAMPAAAQMEPGQSSSLATSAVTEHAPKVTKTLERTTTKTYTVSKRKLGHVGGRPYPTRTETVDGGVVVEKFVNDTKTDTQVIKPDPMLDKKPSENPNRKPYQYPFREYYTDDEGLKALGDTPTDVEIRHNGNFND